MGPDGERQPTRSQLDSFGLLTGSDTAQDDPLPAMRRANSEEAPDQAEDLSHRNFHRRRGHRRRYMGAGLRPQAAVLHEALRSRALHGGAGLVDARRRGGDCCLCGRPWCRTVKRSAASGAALRARSPRRSRFGSSRPPHRFVEHRGRLSPVRLTHCECRPEEPAELLSDRYAHRPNGVNHQWELGGVE